MLKVDQVNIPACSPEISLKEGISSIIGVPPGEIKEIFILRKSIDARKKKGVFFVYNAAVELRDEALERKLEKRGRARMIEGLPPCWTPPPRRVRPPDYQIVVVGSGPAGLFASYILAHYGFKVVLVERGKKIEERVRDVSTFWRKGILKDESNIQFGEGGAGTFSDGKLTTRLTAPEARFVLETFRGLGGGDELTVLGKPHMGTNRLRKVVRSFRDRLSQMGVQFLFEKKVTDLIGAGGVLREVALAGGEKIRAGETVFAPGHSARDNYQMLERRGVQIEAKPFAVGIRVEHPQAVIDEIQYGELAGCGCLPPADYRLAVTAKSGRPVYSFCMCPGGYVILASSEGGDLTVNGMSPTRRMTGYASSGVVAAVGPEDYGSGVFDGVAFQRRLEGSLFTLADERYGLVSSSLHYFMSHQGRLHPSAGRWAGAERISGDVGSIFPQNLQEDLVEGIIRFDRRMKGFISEGANVYGVESRTSSPIRITRGADFQSVSLSGLYPAGEGAGYAGGIVSSAVDGIRSAMAIVKKFSL
ncbi:MAG: FAD-binding protein [Deltaproteobacteria bacterium]|nr:FAD-binding protein [Deltaproteobacteria bacterium]